MAERVKLHTTNKDDKHTVTELEPSTSHQRAVYATATTRADGRLYKIAGSLAAIAFAICDLADAIRESRSDAQR